MIKLVASVVVTDVVVEITAAAVVAVVEGAAVWVRLGVLVLASSVVSHFVLESVCIVGMLVYALALTLANISAQ